MVFVPGAGFVRLLVMGMRLDDLGFSSQLASANARVGALRGAMGGAAGAASALRIQLSILGIAAGSAALAMTAAWSGFERTTALAAFAATESASEAKAAMGTMRQQAIDLARATNTPLRPIADLQKQVAQLGNLTEEQVGSLSRAGAILAKFGDIQASSAAESLFRLVNITEGVGTEGFNKAIKNSVGLASGLKRVADNSAAGVEGVTEFLRKLQVAGVTANFTAQELIAIAGAVTDIDEGVREKTTSSLIRLTAQVIPKAGKEFAEFFRIFGDGIDSSTLALLSTEEGLGRVFAEKPMELLKGLLVASKNLNAAVDDGTISWGQRHRVMEKLGEDNIRDIQTIALLSQNYLKLNQNLRLANDEFDRGLIDEKQTSLMEQYNVLLETMAERITALQREFGIFLSNGGQALANTIGGLVDSLTRMFQVINNNPKAAGIVAGLMTGVPLALVGLGVARLGGYLFRGGLIDSIITGRVGMSGPLSRAGFDPMQSHLEASRMALGAAHASQLGEMAGTRTATGEFRFDDAAILAMAAQQRETQKRLGKLAFQNYDKILEEQKLQAKNFRLRALRTPFGIGAIAMNLAERFPTLAGSFLKTGIGGRIGAAISAMNAGALAGVSRVFTMAVPILNVAAALGLLADVFGFLGRVTNDLRQQGGAVGAIFTGLTIVLKGLEIAGLAVNKIFEGLWTVIKMFFEGVAGLLRAVGLGGVVDAAGNLGNAIITAQDQVIASLRGSPGPAGSQVAQAQPSVNIDSHDTITTKDNDQTFRIKRQAATDMIWRAGLRVRPSG